MLSEVKNGTAKRVVIPETQTVDRRTGVRTTHAKRDVDVDLPAGVEDGQRLRVPGKAYRQPATTAGNGKGVYTSTSSSRRMFGSRASGTTWSLAWT